MKVFRIVGIALIAMYLQTGHAAVPSPESVVRTVSDWYMKDGSVGLPDPAKEPVKSSFSDGLKQAIEHAQAEQDRQMKQFPDQKPAFAETPVITGVPESLASYRIVKSQKTRQAARVSVEWRYKQATGIVKTQMSLALQRGRWVIVDILYGRSRAPLTKVLQDFN